MGLFDSVMVPCPTCGRRVEFQSKAGNCDMSVLSLDDAPTEVLYDILNDPHHCRGCDGWFALVDPKHPPGPRPRPHPEAAKVTAPIDPPTHSQGMKYWPWDREFSLSDLSAEANER